MKQPRFFDYPHLIPRKINEIAAVIGEEATEKLVLCFGGINLKIGKGNIKTERQRLLIEAIGKEAAAKLNQRYGGQTVYIPNCYLANQAIRRTLAKQKIQKLMQQGFSFSMAVTLTAAQSGLSYTAIHKELKQKAPANHSLATFKDFGEACRFIDKHTEPNNAGSLFIKQTAENEYTVYQYN